MMEKVDTKIFCIGLGKTGTTTFQDCMRTLGYKHRGWIDSKLGLLSLIDFESILPIIEHYESFDDYPFPLIYKQLYKTYPNAKFVLTKRKNAEVWANSLIQHSIRKKYNFNESIWYGGLLNLPNRHNLLADFYEKHIDDCREFFKNNPNFIELCWEEGDGWEKLCTFLNKPIVNKEFPKRNSSKPINTQDLIRVLLLKRNYAKILQMINESSDLSLRSTVISIIKNELYESELTAKTHQNLTLVDFSRKVMQRFVKFFH